MSSAWDESLHYIPSKREIITLAIRILILYFLMVFIIYSWNIFRSSLAFRIFSTQIDVYFFPCNISLYATTNTDAETFLKRVLNNYSEFSFKLLTCILHVFVLIIIDQGFSCHLQIVLKCLLMKITRVYNCPIVLSRRITKIVHSLGWSMFKMNKWLKYTVI